MKQHIPLKSALRQPAHTLFLLLLIAAISFAFIARAVEYIIVDREIERLGGHYRAIGHLDGTDANRDAVAEAVNRIAASQYVEFEDRRRIYGGVMQHDYYKDRTAVSFMSDCITDEHLASWRTYPTFEETFEIIGVYGSTVAGNFGSIYIPDSCVPEGFDTQKEHPSVHWYSFVLKSAKDITAFLEENSKQIEKLGLSIRFVDSNAEAFWESARAIKSSAAFSAKLFGGCLRLRWCLPRSFICA